VYAAFKNSELHSHGDQPLLGSVVQIALRASTFGIAGGWAGVVTVTVGAGRTGLARSSFDDSIVFGAFGAEPMPAGRGLFVRRGEAPHIVQVAHFRPLRSAG
jgi:hypothetical protein